MTDCPHTTTARVRAQGGKSVKCRCCKRNEATCSCTHHWCPCCRKCEMHCVCDDYGPSRGGFTMKPTPYEADRALACAEQNLKDAKASGNADRIAEAQGERDDAERAVPDPDEAYDRARDDISHEDWIAGERP